MKLIPLLYCLLFASFAIGQPYILHNEWIDYNKTYYKFKVMGFGLDNVNVPVRKGMVRIPFSALSAAGLGGTASQNFQLWRDGEEVPVYISTPAGPLGSNDYIEFFGEINNGKLDRELYRNPDFQLCDKWSLQTDTAAYFLTINMASANKRLVNTVNNVSSNTLPAAPYFMHTVGRYYRSGDISGGFAANLGKKLYSSSYDMGEGWMSRIVRPAAGCGSASLPQNFTSLYPYLAGPTMTMHINSVGDMQNNRTVQINLNGDSITTFQMDYNNYMKTEEQADVSKISSGNASFQVVDNSTYGCDEMRVAMIELTYPRLFNMGGASVFDFVLDSSSNGQYLEIANFKHGGVAPVLYDMANGKRYVADISDTSIIKVLLEPSVVPYKLVLTTQSGNYFKAITNIQSRTFTNFATPDNLGNYLIISNPLIYGSGASNYVEQYRQYRASADGGAFNAKIIDVNELVDQFAWGVKKHPLAVKNFLQYAMKNFKDTLKNVFIIGKGVTYNEYRANESNSLADKLNLVPTWGNPASDNILASNDFNALPAVPIGRLSAVSPVEVGDYLLKVKQHDSAQRNTVYSIEAKGWMKNVLQIAGANDIGLGSQLDGYLDNYKKIIADTAFGANVTDFSKNADPAGYPEAVMSFKKVYEQGASLITYFGHSSATSLDFNLDNPENYNNPGKYPVFIANGCSAGNNFSFEPNRLNTKSTVSEKFVLSPQRGAAGYLASTAFGVVNYLDLYTKNFYKALAKAASGRSIGSIIKDAITASLDSTGLDDYYSRVHAEQYAFNGDPAITLSSTALPDYIIEAPQITVSPSSISVADSVFAVKVKVYNAGRATKEAVTLKVIRETPDGETFTLLTKTFPAIDFSDSVILQVPVRGNRDKGVNAITATADFTNSTTELSETNNEATIQFNIDEDVIRPVYPYNYAIITDAAAKLSASSVNPLDSLKEYVMELDTTALFNSPFKITKSQLSKGGVVSFDPGITYQPNITYYWHVAKAAPQPHWMLSSFVYNPVDLPGFQQGHLYQHLQSSLTRMSVDSTTGRYAYSPKLHNLFVVNSVYPTSGLEDEHFSVSADGSTYINSACAGASVIFHVFDPLNFAPLQNTTRPFNAAAVCAEKREYNFEYQYTSAAIRKNAMDFMDAIPKGSYVVVRLVLDQPYTFAPKWAADTSLYGKGNSLYHRLKQAGFAAIDSFYYARTWAFIYKKGDSTFKPAYAMSQGVYDRITLSVNCTSPNQQGLITSPVFGPAKEWNSVQWKGYGREAGNDVPVVNVHGIKNDKSDTLLYTLDSAQQNFDISAVSATEYPYIQLQMSNQDSVTATPYQLTKWALQYKPVAEGAIAPNLYFNIPDTAGTLTDSGFYAGKLHLGVAFKNVSKVGFDSLALKAILYDSAGNKIIYPLQKLRPLPAGDTLHIDAQLDVSMLSGWYNVYLEVNPDNDQPEQYNFNNFLYKYVFIDQSKALPVNSLDFKVALQGNNVKTFWSVAGELHTRIYEVQHSTNGSTYIKIGSLPATTSGEKMYSFIHNHPQSGKNYYRLKMIDADGSFTYSLVRMVTVRQSALVNVYPNPVKDMLTISVNRSDARPADIRLLNAFGQQLLHQKISRTVQVNMSALAAGVYIIVADDGSTTEKYKVQKQ